MKKKAKMKTREETSQFEFGQARYLCTALPRLTLRVAKPDVFVYCAPTFHCVRGQKGEKEEEKERENKKGSKEAKATKIGTDEVHQPRLPKVHSFHLSRSHNLKMERYRVFFLFFYFCV
ncbi:hypothetical protein HPB48_012740 [Haemaphysalis longicornis]|uniref:Uncharacterized protein n=1 Tax=Haemaphysalis longicornis TaxID=44386 RepID=A0A9J6G365_HAELO|nr:hypothetical protein HPB48_012740 [Haemaphysalis longicornis]